MHAACFAELTDVICMHTYVVHISMKKLIILIEHFRISVWHITKST